MNGELRISHYGSSPFSGNGDLLLITIQAIGEEGESSRLDFNLAALNEGNPAVVASSGIVFIGIPLPWFDKVDNLSFEENESIQIEVRAHDPLEKDLQLSAQALPPGASFQDLGGGIGQMSWETNYYSAGSYAPRFTALNSDGLSRQLIVNIVVLNVPRAPVLHTPFADFSFDEDSEYLAFYLSDHVSDSDLDQGDILTLSLENNTHIFARLEDDSVVFSADADWFGTENLLIVITDSYGFSVSQQISVTVINVNDPPYQTQALPIITIPEDHPGYMLNLDDYFRDVDNLLLYSVSGGVNIDYQIQDSYLTITPAPDWFGEETVLITATEGDLIHPGGRSLSISANLTVVVTPVNDPPIILRPFPQIEMVHNDSYLLEGLDTYFWDVDSELSYSFSGNDNIDVQVMGNDLLIIPDPDWIGTRRITVKATDDHLESVSQVLVVIVRAAYIYSEDFDHDGDMPTGWTKSGTGWMPYQISENNYGMRVANPQISSTHRLVSPPVNLKNVITPVVSFWYDIQCPSGVTASLQYSLNGISYSNITSFTASDSGFFSVSVPQIANQTAVRIRWHYSSATALPNYWLIDDFAIDGAVGSNTSPPPVQGFSLSAVSNDSVSLSWTPVTDIFFSRYEISVMADSLFSSELFNWSTNNDSQMFNVNCFTTTIGELEYLTKYYFAIRTKDINNNVSAWSEIVPAVISPPPVIEFDLEPGAWFDSRDIVLSCIISDDSMVKASSISYRIDLDNNGVYDETEPWQSLDGYSDAQELILEIPIFYPQDGKDIHIEVRCTDTQNPLFSYSGSESLAGIEDDFYFHIDTTPPDVLQSLFTVSYTNTSVKLSWEPSVDEDFSHYEIYYGTHQDVDTMDNLFSVVEAPLLSVINTGSVNITGLQPQTRYWFRILAVDLAENKGNLSNTVTNILNSMPPLIYAPNPIQEYSHRFANSLQTVIGCKISDAYGVDLETVQYRYDANGNGIYDEDEDWQDVNEPNGSSIQTGLNESGDFEITVTVSAVFTLEADNLRFEFRAKDIDGYGYSYSGFGNQAGIEDDWFIAVDITPPSDILAVTLGIVSVSSAEIYWTASADEHFLGYLVLYGTEPGLGLTSPCFSYEDYESLRIAGTGIKDFLMVNLIPNTSYYVRIAALDVAGNFVLSDEVSFFTSSDTIPKAPQNLKLFIVGSDLTLSWDPVTEDVFGNPITVDEYMIYLSDYPGFEIDESSYFDTVDSNIYIFEGLTEFIDRLFFRVIAVK
ncbi:MAG: fibronectin type III domain-containing protein [Candidatus Syntrophosphaera sp.]|nr:fibronectin type III domain-containing protein [Candidatus Cloacimonadota bacterium]MDX9949790.1 fibronectin type III domain-containing protein [Candidatus Syntrophosphaera sp.]